MENEMNSMTRLILCMALAIAGSVVSEACTSAIVSAARSGTGRPLMWKHRDTGADNNFLARVEPGDSTIGYVALFNGGDSLLTEAWTGMNDAGFAIMNTASYNLMPDTAALKDREGVMMRTALERCRNVEDFEQLLRQWPRPMGVQANFGVIDAEGGAAYFETDDYGWTRFDVADSPDGYIIRTNFSVSGKSGAGYGYIRYNTACRLMKEAETLTPDLFTESISRSYYHSLTGHDYMAEGEHYVADRDFIPRNISTASIVIEGVNSPSEASGITMHAALDYPPCAITRKVSLSDIPADLRASGPLFRSEACDRAMELRKSAVPYQGGSGPDYINLDIIRDIMKKINRQP